MKTTCPKSELSLRALNWKRFLHAPDAQLVDDLYTPALSRAVRYDRCCAYFSSRVLSTAARGFGGFIQNLLTLGDQAPRPAARLIVNEQLDPADLKALLATGDQSRLIDKLLKQFKTPADALEKNRLEMLTWLVASGFMEVRVGIMRHTQGIAHAKFGVVTDLNGDRLAYMGSDNETGASLTENYEELEVRPSWEDSEFVERYAGRFEALWADRDPYVTTIALPDAVRLRLLKEAPKTPPVELKQDRALLETAMFWHFLAAAPYLPNGEYTCDATAPVDLWPHQKRVVDDTARAYPAGRLLCDEVGMGKTVELLMVLRRLLCGRGVKRALLLVPAGLLSQWQDELREKGSLLVPRWESGVLYLPDGTKQKMEVTEALASQPLLLLSREWARLDGNAQTVLAAPAWDLVAMDEAHAARRSTAEEGGFNSANLLLQLLREMQLRRRARGILLLSATPMQTHPWEPWDLLGTLGVGGEWLVDFADLRAYYDGIAELAKGSIGPPAAQKIAHLVKNDAEFPSAPPGLPGNFNSLAFAVPSVQKRYADWLRRGAPLGRRMHRNTRDTLRQYYAQGLLATPPPRRQVDDVLYDYDDPAERKVYESIERYIDARFDQLEHEKPGKGFVMTVYRRRAASSPYALRRSLERRLEGLERVIRRQHIGLFLTAEEVGIEPADLSDDEAGDRIDPALPSSPKEAEAEKTEVEALLARLTALGVTDSKLARFCSLLQEITDDGRAALVFDEFSDTMTYLRDQLRPLYGTTLGCYSGGGGQIWDGQGWQVVSKAEITRRLEEGWLRVLLCTDAASEGLNLQAASALINYSLPFVPAKVEQRIGRIDRIGQVQSVLPIRNLFLNDSVDMRVYQALRHRCGLFEHFVGRMQPVLALARDALRGYLRREDADVFIRHMEEEARRAESDQAVGSAFVPSDAATIPTVTPPATREDIVTALQRLTVAGGRIRAIPDKTQRTWKLTGVERHSISASLNREALERDPALAPLHLGSDLTRRLAERLPLPASRVPLVLAEYACGAFRCVEARWVEGERAIPVASCSALKEHLAAWDGAAPSPAAIVKAQNEAQAAARSRVEQMEEAARIAECAGVESQRASAQARLLRELARTLRCFGKGDLNTIFYRQVQRESRQDGRFQEALHRLNGYPTWPTTVIADAEMFVKRLTPRQVQDRINLPSGLDAALNDPRWRVTVRA
ncbi:MAG TPA: helicase-related protein [Chthonomonadaceae bacterium]|nr:helicase-related protein [Chthonomonadaceae bacterium]